MNFGAPHWLWGLLVVPVLAVLFVRAEQRSAAKLREFVSARLLPQLGATANPFRRRLRFGLVLAAVALAVVALAQPRWGYTYEEVKRKGLDLIVAVDTSRSMLANDVAPNRLQRVKLAAQDLFNELRGDRIGLIAFAGRSFLQAPLTIDYDAAVEALNELDTSIIPEGGSNIADAINLATRTFGESAIGNRALIIFTDGEELSGDAVKVAKTAADAGVKIFTIGVGTPEGSLIPLSGAGGTTSFVKDGSGQVVKSKLDEKRLREIAEATGGRYLHLAGGPATMKQLYEQGLAQMQAGDIQDRISRQPIERYQWPLGAALLALAASLLINERRRALRHAPVAAVYDRRARDVAGDNGGHRPPLQAARSAAASLILLCSAVLAHAAAPGLDEYRNERYAEAFQEFQQTLQEHPNSRATDKIHFGAGAAAYKMKDYAKALQSFSQALLSPDRQLQSRSHYNLGNTLYQRGETQKANDKKLADWENALQHYEQTLKIEPENKEAKENAEFVRKKIEELKEQQPPPTPSPSPNPQAKKDQKKSDQQQQQQQQQQNKDQQQQDQSGSGDNQKPEDGQDQSQQQQEQKPGEENQPGQTPSPSPGSSPGSSPSPSPAPSAGASPSPGDGTGASPTPGEEDAAPSPSPGEGDAKGEGGDTDAPPSGTPSPTPQKKLEGDVRGAAEDQTGEAAEAGGEAQQINEAQMSPEQAERLLRAMREEEQRVQLDERKASRRVYNDW